jgi:hypothetical protein
MICFDPTPYPNRPQHPRARRDNVLPLNRRKSAEEGAFAGTGRQHPTGRRPPASSKQNPAYGKSRAFLTEHEGRSGPATESSARSCSGSRARAGSQGAAAVGWRRCSRAPRARCRRSAGWRWSRGSQDRQVAAANTSKEVGAVHSPAPSYDGELTGTIVHRCGVTAWRGSVVTISLEIQPCPGRVSKTPIEGKRRDATGEHSTGTRSADHGGDDSSHGRRCDHRNYWACPR